MKATKILLAGSVLAAASVSAVPAFAEASLTGKCRFCIRVLLPWF